MSKEAKDIIQLLLKKNPYERLGHKTEVKAHPWFKSINFDDIINKRISPPIIPKLSDKFDVNNFDSEFTNEDPINSVVEKNSKFLQKFDNEFGAVTFV